MKRTLLLIAIAGLSTSAVAQQKGSNPSPFNDDPIINKANKAPQKASQEQSQSRSGSLADKQIESQGEAPRSGAEVIKNSRDDVVDKTGLPRPIDLPDLPVPTTVKDIYRGAEDFRVRGSINGANVEYSQAKEVYRISGGNSFKSEESSKSLKVKKNDDGYELEEGYGKEMLSGELEIEQQKQGEK